MTPTPHQPQHRQMSIPAPSPWPRRIVRFAAGAAVLAVLLVGCLAIAATSPVPPLPASSAPPAVPIEVIPPSSAPVDTQAADGSLAGDGTYAVGSDAEPGTYRSRGADDLNGVCYWARLKNTDGDLDSIIANDVGKGPQVVTIKRTDGAFTTRGCDTWTRAS